MGYDAATEAAAALSVTFLLLVVWYVFNRVATYSTTNEKWSSVSRQQQRDQKRYGIRAR